MDRTARPTRRNIARAALAWLLAAALAGCAAPPAETPGPTPAPPPPPPPITHARASDGALLPLVALGDAPVGAAVRTVPAVAFSDLARNPLTGDLYGATNSGLHRIDETTGAVQDLGPIGVYDMNALAFDPQGRLYGGTERGVLLRIDPTTGRGTAINPEGLAEGISGDLAFTADGTLYAVLAARTSDRLVTLDPTTGAATSIGLVGRIDVFGLTARGERLYGLTRGGELLSLDRATGAATTLRRTGLSNVYGME